MTAINKSNRFPVALQGVGSINATYINGVWVLFVDYEAVDEAPATDNPGDVLIYNADTETLGRIPFKNLITAYLAALPTSESGLSVGDHYWNGGVLCRVEA